MSSTPLRDMIANEVLVPVHRPSARGVEGTIGRPPTYLRIGNFAEVLVTEANEHDLRGKVVR